MRTSRAVRVAVWCIVGVTIGSGPLTAQGALGDDGPSILDFGLGITLNGPKDVNRPPQCTQLSLPCSSPRTFPDFGLALQASVFVGSHAAIVAEANTYINRWIDTSITNGTSVSRDNHAKSVLIGPRVMSGVFHPWGDPNGWRVFAQLLGGPESSTILPTRFAWQPGAGIDVKLSRPGMWFRGSTDYRWTRGGPRNLSGNRILAALVVAP
jgi:hypothetical protein